MRVTFDRGVGFTCLCNDTSFSRERHAVHAKFWPSAITLLEEIECEYLCGIVGRKLSFRTFNIKAYLQHVASLIEFI